MKKLLEIVVLTFFLCTSAYAWCSPEFGSLFDWSKEHKACGQYARNLKNLEDWQSSDAYCSCRIRLDNLKKYGIEKLGPDDFREYPGLRSVNP
jgi:hypothetical protein|tara:strand:- start:55 stop:333 length:279 start_codon:yes stop_codon:yes gene_type:complete